MASPDPTTGFCPHCEDHAGPVGELCPERLCARKGYHHIHADQLKAARTEADRKGIEIDPMLGKRIAKYILVGKLGEGGMGAVYLGLQMPLRRVVAVKLILAADLDELSLKRFAREAETMASLDHPNIVKLYDFGPEDYKAAMPFMVLEVVHGRPLRDEMSERRKAGHPWSPDEVRRLSYQVLSGLETAHRAGLVHRDIKPDNIMLQSIVGDPNHVKILDFGLAKAVEQLKGAEKLSKTGLLVGTPSYMAPEQFMVQRATEIDYRVDLYAVGVIAFEIIMGQKPFAGRTWKEIASLKLSPNYRPQDDVIGATLPPALNHFLSRSLAREPDLRFQNAMEMYHALDEALNGPLPASMRHAEAATDAGPPTRTPPPASGLNQPSAQIVAPARTPSPAPRPRDPSSSDSGALASAALHEELAARSRGLLIWIAAGVIMLAIALWTAVLLIKPATKAPAKPAPAPTQDTATARPDAKPGRPVEQIGAPKARTAGEAHPAPPAQGAEPAGSARAAAPAPSHAIKGQPPVKATAPPSSPPPPAATEAATREPAEPKVTKPAERPSARKDEPARRKPAPAKPRKKKKVQKELDGLLDMDL
jgi:serine/threonine protein kinase